MPNRKISPKSLSARIEELRRRHRDLDGKVAREQLRPWPDAARLHQLKRERLGLKDTLRATQALLHRTVGGRMQQSA